MDWSMVNYSSARAALNEVWRHIQTMFSAFAEQVADPIRFAVIEEAFDKGYIKTPTGCRSSGICPAPIYAGAGSAPAVVMSTRSRKPKARRCGWAR
jgi:capsid protein